MSAKRAERLQVMLTIDEVRRVEEWRYEHRMPSRSAAVRALMNLGLRAHAAVNESALLEGSVASRDVGVVDNGSLVDTAEGRPAVLVVAEEYLEAQGISRVLEHAGYRVIGPARSLEEANGLAGGSRLAAAVLDARPGGEAGAVADWLARQRVPFVRVADDEQTAPARGAPTVNRRNAGENLARAIADLIA